MTHYLVVGPLNQETGIPEWDIEHNDDCPREEMYPGMNFPWADYTCPVGCEISFSGLATLGARSPEEWPDDIPRVPGKYAIEFWSKTTHHYFGDDTDSGIRIIGR